CAIEYKDEARAPSGIHTSVSPPLVWRSAWPSSTDAVTPRATLDRDLWRLGESRPRTELSIRPRATPTHCPGVSSTHRARRLSGLNSAPCLARARTHVRRPTAQGGAQRYAATVRHVLLRTSSAVARKQTCPGATHPRPLRRVRVWGL